MTLSSLRKRVAKMRDAVVHGRRNRGLAEQAARMRADWIDEAARSLAALPEAPERPVAEVHSVSGEAQATMGLFSSWSLMRFLPQARFVLHSDGSLSEETVAVWKSILPGMRVVDPEAGETAMSEQLADSPHVLRWSRDYHFGPKIGSIHCLADAPRIIDMDTDVLVLSDPVALRDALAGDGRGMFWNRGHQYAYAYPEPLLSEVLGDLIGPLPERLNGGFLLAPRNGSDEWYVLEEILRRLWADARIDPLRYWMHQTLVACLASRLPPGLAAPLPEAYAIYMGATRPGTTVRHYVGNPGVRPRFFTEGVPRLIADAVARGHLPEDFAAGALHDHVDTMS